MVCFESYIFVNCKLASPPCELADSDHTCYHLVFVLFTFIICEIIKYHYLIVTVIDILGNTSPPLQIQPLITQQCQNRSYHAAYKHHEESSKCSDGHLISSTSNCRAGALPSHFPPLLLQLCQHPLQQIVEKQYLLLESSDLLNETDDTLRDGG